VRFSYLNRISGALSSLLWLAAFSAASAQPEGRCSRETLSVTGLPVTVSYCVLGASRSADGRETTVNVQEAYSSPRGSFAQTSPLSFLAGNDPSRVIEDVSLARLGMSGTLHLTLIMRGGRVLVEAAILTPGAIVVK
jgi:hypothetical protein